MDHLEVHPIEHKTSAGYVGIFGVLGSLILMAWLIWKRNPMPHRAFWALCVFVLVVGAVSATVFLPVIDVVSKYSSGSGDDDDH
jgi:hypothetical protein